MLILKIVNVFLPAAFAANGKLCDPMDPPYIGFEAEVLQELSWEKKVISDSAMVGTRHLILEKCTRESATFHKGDMISVPSEVLQQGLLTLPREEWLAQPKMVINNHSTPFIKRYAP